MMVGDVFHNIVSYLHMLVLLHTKNSWVKNNPIWAVL